MSSVTLILQIMGVLTVALVAASEFAARSASRMESPSKDVTKIVTFDAIRRFEDFLDGLQAFESHAVKAMAIRDDFFMPAELAESAVQVERRCLDSARPLEASAPRH